ncbi:tigger transposable element-derived protein 6 isoform X1 [Tetranychus urticae]|uniref:tigger transposable element-derived protein 6 isoform X1 n=1 Tax=Tetranychus urticae TaxID=32264 RepID=UPI000D65345D|nr:tigger transposable element-derived protein 6 isoform X1 [Tetranychus urticae]
MPRRNLSILEKTSLIEDIENGLEAKEATKLYKVSPRTIFRTLSNKQNLLEACENGQGKRTRIEKNEMLRRHDDEVKLFILKCLEKGIPLKATFIIEKAKMIAHEMGYFRLQCSWQWFKRFRERIKLKQGTLSGERISVNSEVVKDWRENKIPRIMLNWQKEFVFNCDETSLFWRQSPSKTYFISKTDHIGDKIFHERISILFCVNQAGQKLKPLIIGKAAKPRCFYKDCLLDLELTYVSQSNAWMNLNLFTDWLKNWHIELVGQNKKVLLLLDNFKGHKINTEDFPMITFNFLPPSTTSLTQPLDGGIIRAFKAKYLNIFVKYILNGIDSGRMSDIVKNINLLNALNWVDECWKAIPEQTICNCWSHFGYVSLDLMEINNVYEEELVTNLNELSLNLTNCCSSKEFIEQVSFDYLDFE